MTEETAPPPRPKKRGAPLGNTNALKHGFYSRRFPQVEIDSLAELPEGLAAEIQMMRLLIQRVMDFADQVHDLDQALRLVNTLGRATAYLDRLVRTQYNDFRKHINYPVDDSPQEAKHFPRLYGLEKFLTFEDLEDAQDEEFTGYYAR